MAEKANSMHDISRAHNGRHMLHPFSIVNITDTTPPLIIDRGEGSFIYDID